MRLRRPNSFFDAELFTWRWKEKEKWTFFISPSFLFRHRLVLLFFLSFFFLAEKFPLVTPIFLKMGCRFRCRCRYGRNPGEKLFREPGKKQCSYPPFYTPPFCGSPAGGHSLFPSSVCVMRYAWIYLCPTPSLLFPFSSSFAGPFPTSGHIIKVSCFSSSNIFIRLGNVGVYF